MPFIQHCLGGKRSLHEYYSGGCDVQVRILQRTSNPGSGSSLRPMTHEEVEASLYNTHLSAGSQAPHAMCVPFLDLQFLWMAFLVVVSHRHSHR